ncbi:MULTISPECIES: 2-succinyl-5-enolpyruvyl-6-hydroxy-3-cyclohexene-1-carboxylic-acid synthase [Synechococcaceae]|uniref:2-succinyl-5-enolpyruvyl-6-hydroxy-3- cyclohexene-1-carboxylic-acid synthase n=1 Tax=Synechococcaceae TaxID=1890426 RepID=UPI000A748B11|nr:MULTISPECIES: 2-succinyl-5-enolpyruvyl-6-hydroxy-3-cyclohexene-1-carboxylic-acid synthase [Synechococcaceae]MCT4366623.1 2-succinyl-5-enolpyruvyl-6-hydroxy-3-cyclohexene-1-carboxylic-acid synthase [Candidatus Regnicoccus frigidus MAG-AL2]TWB88306.1 2-succinyl-5-enolpyruvyl-6-hydroxy-3-cyclohexene-1-carboxylate synthase [Synechococcus sp. Ace-Pa]
MSAAGNLEASLILLQGLQRLGLRRLVLCPGSRSAALAVAAGMLAGPRLSLQTGIDERSAAFFALGLSRADGVPAAVITTSGTAVANLLPAVVEADHGAIPLLLLSADRPAHRKGCGANQTVNQEDFLRPSCRWVGEAEATGLAAMGAAALEAMAERAWRSALGYPAGPVHLNLPFEEPLHADAGTLQRLAALWLPAASSAEVVARPDGALTGLDSALSGLDPDQPGLIVAGPWRGTPADWPAFLAALRHWQQRSGWPLLADGLSGLRGQSDLVCFAGYDLLLEAAPLELAAAQVLRLGPTPSSRRLQQWLAGLGGHQLLICEADPRNQDPLGTATSSDGLGLAHWCQSQSDAIWRGQPAPASTALQQRWRQREATCQALLDHNLPASGAPSEPALARALSLLLPADRPVMLASSSPVRDWESFADPRGPARPFYGFRGASGIDGTLSLAAGLAESLGQLVLVCGDLALLHDSTGWLWGQQLTGQLTVVLIDNGGGGIFEQLPIRTKPETGTVDFERLFAMPQRLDHRALAAAHGVPSRRVERLDDLAAALHWSEGEQLALLELRTDRRADAQLRELLRASGGHATE